MAVHASKVKPAAINQPFGLSHRARFAARAAIPAKLPPFALIITLDYASYVIKAADGH